LVRDDTLCAGAIDTIESDPGISREPRQSIVKGWAKPSPSQREITVIVIANSENQVAGFGIPGFANAVGQGSGWAAVVQYPKTDISAFAIVSHDKIAICRLCSCAAS
jgi:hypothetical protein